MTITIYGIKTCDTVRKARNWLESNGADFSFVDYRAEPLDPQKVVEWEKAVGWEKLLNRSSTTFRSLSESEKRGIDQPSAIALMQAHPTLIKRPVLEVDGAITVGFKPDIYEKAVTLVA